MAPDVKSSPDRDAHEQLKALGKYHIHKRLGAGGMGAVFLATDSELKRTVALKVLPKDRAENPTLVRRFKAEAQAVAQLRHDNIVAIYEAGQIDGFPYIALEYVEGADVLTLIEKRGVLPPKRSLKIVQQVAQALQHAHEKNIVHRDIKPSNLLIRPDGVVKLTDLGLARSVDETLDTSITRAGTTVGTVDYISPEQACDSKAADVRSDIYSLGCTWYHMLTGAPPYTGDMKNKLHGHLHVPAPDPRHENANVPEAYVAVMHQMMAKKPQDRYQSPAELLEDLEKIGNATTGVSYEMMEGMGAESPARAPAPASPTIAEFDLGEPSKKDPRLVAKAEQAKQKTKPPRTKAGAARRQGAAEDLEAGEADPDASSKTRKLPPRKQKSPEGFTIDLDYARIGLAAVLVLGVVGLFWWAFSRGADNGSARRNEEGPLPPSRVADSTPVADDPRRAGDSETTEEQEQTEVQIVAASAERVSRDGEPFPGTDDLPGPNSAPAREYVPDWVYAARTASAAEMPTVTLESSPRPGAPATIQEALARLKGGRRRVILSGDGVFPMTVGELPDIEHLQIRAASNSRPLIVFAGREQANRTTLQMSRGVIELDGVHLLAGPSADRQPRTLLKLGSGTLILRNCTVSTASDSGPVTVCEIDPRGDAGDSRVLIEHTLIRGGDLTAVRARGQAVDVMAGGSLLASQAGPVLDVEVVPPPPQESVAVEEAAAAEGAAAPSDEAAADAETKDADEPQEQPVSEQSFIRLLGSAVATGGDAIRLSQPRGTGVGRCRVQVRRSVLASAGNDDAAMLALPTWPTRATNLAGGSRAAGLVWKQDRSRLVGWNRLVRLQSGDKVEFVDDESQWQSFWAAPLESESLLPAISDLNLQDAGEAVRRQLASAAAGITVGPSQALPEPPSTAIERFVLLEGRPRLPEGYRDLPDAKTVRFDLKTHHHRLNDLLNSEQVPDGARVELVGLGLVSIPPIELNSKRLQLEFIHEGGGAPLIIRPDSVKGTPPEAFLTVRGGRLDLLNAHIQCSPSKSRNVPPRVLLVEDGELTIRDCLIEGPLHDEPPDAPLIEWRRSDDAYRYGYIADTLFAGRQPLLSTDSARSLLVLHNSILAGYGDCLTLRSSAGAAEVARADRGWTLLDHCTFLTGGAAVRLSGPAQGRSAPAAHVLSTACVFAPAPGASAKEAVVMTHPAGMSSGNLFDWWETRNGYAGSLAQFRLAGNETGASQEFQRAWTGFWGADHVEQPLTGQSGVIFKSVLSTLQDLTPPRLSLASNSGAARWAPDGGPVGARPDEIGPRAAAPSPSPANVREAPTSPARRPSSRPDF